MKDPQNRELPWRRILYATGLLEIILAGLVSMPAAVLGFSGFAAGEMGTMVGILASSVLIFSLPHGLARFLILRGIRKGKRWAPLFSIILSALLLLGGLSFFGDMRLLQLFSVVYNGTTMAAGVKVFKQPLPGPGGGRLK